jgi:flagellar FliL protein
MAETPKDDEAATESAEPVAKKSSKKLLIIIAAAVLVLGGGGAAAYFMLGHGDEEAVAEEESPVKDGKGKAKTAKEKGKKDKKEEKPKAPAQYVKLDPPFVTNFESKGLVRFLQITVEVMTRDPATVEMLKLHDPMIRNDLLLLLSNQQYEVISTRQGKEQLRTEALQTVAKVISSEGGDGKTVEQLFFTSFVMQ